MKIDLSDEHKSRYEVKRAREREVLAMRKLISSWKREKLQAYVYNHNKEHPCNDGGMAAILERFIYNDEFQIGDMSEELKTGFDIVLSISRNSKITYETTDLIYEFVKHFKEVIISYDRQSAQTYLYKLKKAYEQSVELVNAKMEIEREIRVKY